MADVFLSYRNTVERRAFVKRLALLLRAHEVSVWWDYGLEAGESYREQIVGELARSRLVAPLWCAESIASKWVAMEAELGKDKLIPARLQKVIPPDAFEAIQAADLIGWDGSVQHPRVLAYVAKICERLGKPSRAPIDMMEELSELRTLSLLPDPLAPQASAPSPGMDFVLADLRATWGAFAGKEDTAAAERFLARVRGTAPGSGLEFEIEEHLAALRAESGRREGAQRAQAEAVRQQSEAQAGRAAEEARRRTPGAEFRDGEGLPLMVTIPPGKFLMGLPASEKDRFDNGGPQREVTIAYPLAVGKFPVTLGEWRTFSLATGRDTGASAYLWTGSNWEDVPGRGWASPGFAQDESHPVTCVNWDDASAYATWLRQLTGQPYRLMSESEWEYACRAGTATRYAFGDEIVMSQANFNNEKRGTAPVGAYPANKFGLHDMHGNASEWVQDWYAGRYEVCPKDGAANDRKNSNRVYRGGSWVDLPRNLRSAVRFSYSPTGRSNNLGFRVARTLARAGNP